MNARRFFHLSLVLLLMGCGKPADPNRPKTIPVTGTVTYKGQPVEGATVTFFGGTRGAVGLTDASGGFKMTTFEAADGAIPGTYKVMITKTVLEGAPAETGTGTASGAEPFFGTEKDLLPAKYKDVNQSGLTAEVKEGAAIDLKFDLTD